MAQVINTNIPSLNAQRNLSTSQAMLSTAMQRLSSGLRVNSAKDDAAGLAISERMNAQVRGMNQAIRNSADGISLAQTAEGALGAISSNLQRMRELAVQAANATSSSDLTSLDGEYQQLVLENTRLIAVTKFNGTQLLTGATALTFQVGADNNANNQISVTTGALNITSGDLTSTANSQTAMDNMDTAISAVSTLRATYGATQTRFETVISGLQTASENTAAARSRIVDADFAAETANLTRANILQQAGTAMLAQANSLPNQVLTLLRG